MHEHRGTDTCGHSEKVAICKPKREVSDETNLALPWPWTSGLQNCCLSNLPMVFCYSSHSKWIYLGKILTLVKSLVLLTSHVYPFGWISLQQQKTLKHADWSHIIVKTNNGMYWACIGISDIILHVCNSFTLPLSDTNLQHFLPDLHLHELCCFLFCWENRINQKRPFSSYHHIFLPGLHTIILLIYLVYFFVSSQ